MYKLRSEKLQSLLEASLVTQLDLKRALIYKTYPKALYSSELSVKDSETASKSKSKLSTDPKAKLPDSKSEEMIAQIYELLEQNQQAELELQKLRVESQDTQERCTRLESELQSIKKAYEEAKLSLSKNSSESSENNSNNRQ